MGLGGNVCEMYVYEDHGGVCVEKYVICSSMGWSVGLAWASWMWSRLFGFGFGFGFVLE